MSYSGHLRGHVVKQRSVSRIRESFFSFSNIVVNVWNNFPVCADFTSLGKFCRSLSND